MGLVLGLGQDDLDRAHDRSRRVFGGEHHALARATLAAAPRQNASALARDIGSMKLTDAPPSTQSISTSLRPSISRSPMIGSRLI